MSWNGICVYLQTDCWSSYAKQNKKRPFPSQFGIENLINGCVPAINLLLALYRLCPLSKNDNITQTIWFIQNLALKRWICDGLSFNVTRALENHQPWNMAHYIYHEQIHFKLIEIMNIVQPSWLIQDRPISIISWCSINHKVSFH